MSTRIAIEETYELPSRGKFPGVPEKITLRAMSLLDEKRRLASQSVNGIVDLISSCTVHPENFDAYKMTRFDVDFCMLKLRIVSHGPQYNVEVICPYCGKVNKVTLNLDDIPTNYVEDDFEYIKEIGPLPISGDVIKVKMLTFADLDKLETESKRIISKFPNYQGDPSDVLNYIYKIVSINGEENIPYSKLKTYVETMTAADSIYFDQMYNEFLGKYGPDTIIPFTCEHCKESFVKMMPMNSEFFRPKYNITER